MNQFQLFSVSDIFILLAWGFVLYWISATIKTRFGDPTINRFFYFGWGFKLFFAVTFALVYFIILNGGDINAYWESATTLNKLFVSNPSGYFQELWHTDRTLGISLHFNAETGYPPGWIWRETEAWNAAKILSLFSIVTFNSFFATTLLLASVVFFISWMISFRILKEENISSLAVMIAFVFFPSVTFWCSGIGKDSLVYGIALLLIYQLFSLLKWDKVFSIKRLLFALFLFYFLYGLRHFIALAVVVPFILALTIRFANRWRQRPILLILFRIIIYSLTITLFFYFANNDQTKKLIAEAQITQNDFSQNPIYTGAKYKIEGTDGSTLALVQSFPQAVFIALYRPFLTDNLGNNFLINGLESAVLMLLSFFFIFNRNLFSNIAYIYRSEFAVYSLTFVLIIAFMAGYTSILFGVLVRIRAIALPFFFLILTFRKKEVNPKI
jgi:hypothetical protein